MFNTITCGTNGTVLLTNIILHTFWHGENVLLCTSSHFILSVYIICMNVLSTGVLSEIKVYLLIYLLKTILCTCFHSHNVHR